MKRSCDQNFAATVILGVCSIIAACSQADYDANAGREDGFITTDDGVRLYYVEQGSGSDVLVAPVAFYLEPHLLDALSRNRRVILFDPRNRGRSDAAPLSSVSLERSIDDVEAIRTGLKLEKMALLGWSGLGMEMAVYALRHPDRVTRLIQISPVPPAASIMMEAGDARNEQVDASAIDALDRRADAGEFEESPEAYCRLRNALTDPANFVDVRFVDQIPDVCALENEWPINLWRYFGALLPSFGDYDWRDDLVGLRIPRLVIHGREDGIPLSGAKAWAAGYPEARLIILSPSGHFPYIEQKEAVIAAIQTFLNGSWPAESVSVDANQD